MWNTISIVILIIEALLLLGFIIGKINKKKLNETALFIGIVFIVNLSLHFVPYLYRAIEIGERMNHIFGFLECFSASLKLFVGSPSIGAVSEFAEAFPIFSFSYLLGIAIALLTTISAAIEAFSNSIVNSFRVSKALKKENCDIVIGNGMLPLNYAKNTNAILLLDEDVSKDTREKLIADGYVVLCSRFSEHLLKKRQFNTTTRYNFICADTDMALNYIDTFIVYKKTETNVKKIYLYVGIEGAKAETVRREVIEKNGVESFVDIFSTNELLARTFVEENPITRHLQKSHIENGAVKENTNISVYILGYGNLSREIYRQSVLNNQLVTYDGEYKVLPINYYLCDKGIDPSEWNICGLEEAISELDPEAHFPLPEAPFKVGVIDMAPNSREVFASIKKQVEKDNSYTVVIINTEDDCNNIEIGAKLKTLLFGMENYHLFARSEASYTENDSTITYFGKSVDIFNHDVIVNDSLSVMAKKLNEVYTAQYAGVDERNRLDFARYIKRKAEKNWEGLDYFTLYSNIYSAMNLRVKLNLLGLDYIKDGNSTNVSLIKERHGHKGKYAYSEYFEPTVRNALIAQEHARWNAYHLMAEYLPLSKNGITVCSDDGKKVRFNVKNAAAKKHACLTTFNGINDLSSYLAEKAGRGCSAADYDYYIYDEMLISSAEKLLSSLGYSVIEK